MSFICIYVGGVLSIALAVMHTRYYILFNWKDDFEKIGFLNQKIFYTIHLALLLLFILFGVNSLIYAQELSQSIGLAFGINLSYALFWLWRFIWQILYFKRQKGKKLPLMAYIFIIWFFLLFVTYIIPVFLKVVG